MNDCYASGCEKGDHKCDASKKKATTHEIEGWESLVSAGVLIEKLRGEGGLLWVAIKDPGGDFSCGIYDEKKLKAAIASLLTHQQERIIAALEGKKVDITPHIEKYPDDQEMQTRIAEEITSYNHALTQAIRYRSMPSMDARHSRPP